MKLSIVYDPLNNKMRDDTYSYIYKGMFEALVDFFNPSFITQDCNASEIDADAILFWDVNSCHHIEIKGIEKHSAIKLEYMSDPFQKEMVGMYPKYNMPVHKLSAKQRIYRALDRGISYIICPVKAGYYTYFAPILKDKADKMLLYFPCAPWFKGESKPLTERESKVLANGAVSNNGIGYDFRYWAFQRPNVSLVKHHIADNTVPSGKVYGEFLKRWAGGLALDDWYPVPKYFEMPLAGCVTFVQYHKEFEELGFKDFESCICVDKDNFDERIKDFINEIPEYQYIADNGRKLMEDNYTAQHFAKFIDKKIGEHFNV